MSHQGQPPYQPEEGTPIAILYAHAGYTSSGPIARDVGMLASHLTRLENGIVKACGHIGH